MQRSAHSPMVLNGHVEHHQPGQAACASDWPCLISNMACPRSLDMWIPACMLRQLSPGCEGHAKFQPKPQQLMDHVPCRLQTCERLLLNMSVSVCTSRKLQQLPRRIILLILPGSLSKQQYRYGSRPTTSASPSPYGMLIMALQDLLAGTCIYNPLRHAKHTTM